MSANLFERVPPGWTVKSVADVCERVTSGGTPSRSNAAYYQHGVWPWVKTQELLDTWIEDTQEHITDEAVQSSSAKVLPANTVLMAMYGATVGQLGVLRRPMTCNQACCALIVDESQAHFRFVYYLLLAARARICSLSTGAAQQNLSGGQIKQFRFAFPRVLDQQAIANALGALDDKIELNHRTSETLESIAQAIFKSWFIDFEPVRALAKGEPSGSVAARLGLSEEAVGWFPGSFSLADDVGLPTGWTISTLGEQARRCGGLLQTGPFGSQLHASDYIADGVPVVMPQDLVRRRISTERIARVSSKMAAGLSRHTLKPGDVVYSRRGDVERHALVGPREGGWLCGTGCLLVRMGPAWPSQAYLSEALNEKTTREWIVRHAVGATMPNLNTSILSAVPILMPPTPLLAYFEAVVGSMRVQQESLSAESESLASLRDELLPKLVSGELSLEEVEA